MKFETSFTQFSAQKNPKNPHMDKSYPLSSIIQIYIGKYKIPIIKKKKTDIFPICFKHNSDIPINFETSWND